VPPFSVDHLGDLVHVGVVVGGGGSLGSRRDSRSSSAVGLITTKVVLHLGIELFGSLSLRLSSTTSLLLVGTGLRRTSSAVDSSLGTLCGSSLGLLLSGGLRLAVKMLVV
jgi:hypothetical protein